MKLADKAEVQRLLGALVGKQLCRAKNAADMKCFGFGEEVQVDAESWEPEYDLHLMCPWRIEDKQTGRLVTGLSDFYVRATDNGDPHWEASSGKGSLQNERMYGLLHGLGSPLTSNRNTFGQLTVVAVSLLPYYGLQIDLSPHYRLVLFPNGCAGEAWWFIVTGPPPLHYFVQDDGLWLDEGSQDSGDGTPQSGEPVGKSGG